MAPAVLTSVLVGCCAAQTLSPLPQPSGFFRVKLGDDEIVALNDGVVSYPISRVLPAATPEAIANGISNGVSDPVAMSYNAFLIRTPTRLVLIDTGTGGKLDNDPSFHGCGHLIANLRAAGFRPEQIDEVLITHRGQDHTGGLTNLDGTRRTFPNAIVQFHDPDLGSSFDSDPKAAAQQRRRILGLAAARGYWIAGSHLPFPGIGQVRAAGNGFSFSPVGSHSVLGPPSKR